MRTKQGVSRECSEATPLRELRDILRLPRPVFARLMGCSERALANWESGRRLPEIYRSRLGELQNLYNGLFETMEPKTIGSWITTPNDEFDGLKPIELIERGENFRIWRMIFRLQGKQT
jgi:transcriptional regulator with XRE-family HTH domain